MLAKAPVLFAVNRLLASIVAIIAAALGSAVRPRLKAELLNTSSLVEDAPKSATVFVAARRGEDELVGPAPAGHLGVAAGVERVVAGAAGQRIRTGPGMDRDESPEVKVEPLTVLPELPSLTVITPEVPVKLAVARVRVLAAPLASPIVVKPETLVRLSVPVLAKSRVRRAAGQRPVDGHSLGEQRAVELGGECRTGSDRHAVERPELVKTGLDHTRSLQGAAGHRAAVEDKVAGYGEGVAERQNSAGVDRNASSVG